MNFLLQALQDIFVFGTLGVATALGVAITAIMMMEVMTYLSSYGPSNYCMCEQEWEYGQTQMVESFYWGMGGTVMTSRPGVCVYWC